MSDSEIEPHFNKLMDLGESSGVKAEEWAFILYISAKVMMQKLDIEIDSEEVSYEQEH